MTLVCLLVVGALGAMLVRSALREAQQSRQREQQLQTLWLVESGLDRGLARLAASADYTGETWNIPADALGGRDAATVGIVVESIEENTAARRIAVEAIYPDDPQRRIVQRRTIQVELLPTGEES
jgi:Tfp pilus assembly protein PilV